MIPAIIIGAINGPQNLIIGLSTYAFIFTTGKVFSKAEKSYKMAFSDNVELGAQIEEMIYQWDNKTIPTFRI